MDRQIIYTGEIPQSSDFLTFERSAMIGLGYLAQMCVGSGITVVDGLACTPTVPASLSVNVAPGSILTTSVIDQTSMGVLPADSTDPLVKMGVNTTATSFTLTAPSTSGFSTNYLIEASFSETDTMPIVLPYYNSSNPSQPFSGPNNAGTEQNTQRIQRCTLQLKAGSPAATGSQTTPAVDSGWVGLYEITVNNGQTQINASNIITYANAPFITTKIPAMRTVLQSNLNLYVAPTGSDANNGLSATYPFATMQHAWNLLMSDYDLNNHAVTINVANGTYTAMTTCQGSPIGWGTSSSVTFLGNSASPSSCVINLASPGACFAIDFGADVFVNGFQLIANVGSGANEGNCLSTGTASSIAFSNIIFGAAQTAHLQTSTGGIIQYSGSGTYVIAGSAGQSHAIAGGGGGYVNIGNAAITLTGTPAFPSGFANAQAGGFLYAVGDTFSGAATGPRYIAVTGGSIQTAGGGGSFFPGSTAGSAPTGYYT